jgi:hypothetical protein
MERNIDIPAALPALVILAVPAGLVGWLLGPAAGIVGYVAFIAGLMIGFNRPEQK